MERLSQSVVFQINAARVAHQTLDGQTIIIDFATGSYFSANETATLIWQQIAQNASVDRILQALTQSYAGEADVIRHAVEQFLDELQRESLILPMDGALSAFETASAMPSPNSTTLSVFQAPSLEKYVDMQDLLLLDAIHDVDAQGWPLKKAEVRNEAGVK